MSMRELEHSASEALVSAGDSAHLPGLAGRESNRNARADREALEVATERGELARVWASLGPFEWVALGYLLLSSAMIFAFAKNLARTNVHPWKLIGTQAIVAIFIFLLCGAAARAEERAELTGIQFSTEFWRFWRCWYPHLFFLFCFEELAYLVHLVNPNWQDAKLIALDHWMFGVHPAVWLEQFATPVRNDFMQLAYLTYFVYLVVLGGILYYRKQWHAYWSVMTYSAAAYAIGYVIAMLFPIESPWFAMAGMWHGELHGGPFTATINFIEHYGRVRGAAFPSEHVAGSVAALWGAWRFRRWLFWVMVPLIVAMCVSTVWGRYHYVADIFGGIVTGTLGYLIGSWIMRRSGTALSEQNPGCHRVTERTESNSERRLMIRDQVTDARWRPWVK
jgi:membrane-associated phospholipid phosphatase